MANTYTLIASSTVGSGGAANIEFTSIPATYTDLIVKLSSRFSGSLSFTQMIFNNSTTGYSYRSILGDGSSIASYNATGSYFEIQYSPGSSQTASTFTNAEIYIPNYAGSNKKSISIFPVQENNATSAHIVPMASLWNNTAAITSIKLTPNTGTFVQYTTAYLYGIKNS
jgi:hypothetical protein